jgi:hypothetical protein
MRLRRKRDFSVRIPNEGGRRDQGKLPDHAGSHGSPSRWGLSSRLIFGGRKPSQSRANAFDFDGPRCPWFESQAAQTSPSMSLPWNAGVD